MQVIVADAWVIKPRPIRPARAARWRSMLKPIRIVEHERRAPPAWLRRPLARLAAAAARRNPKRRK